MGSVTGEDIILNCDNDTVICNEVLRVIYAVIAVAGDRRPCKPTEGKETCRKTRKALVSERAIAGQMLNLPACVEVTRLETGI